MRDDRRPAGEEWGAALLNEAGARRVHYLVVTLDPAMDPVRPLSGRLVDSIPLRRTLSSGAAV